MVRDIKYRPCAQGARYAGVRYRRRGRSRMVRDVGVGPCAKGARYAGARYRRRGRSRMVRDVRYRPVRKMRTLRRWLIPPPW